MFRLIPLTVHSAIEIVVASAVMAAPFALGFGPAALVTSFAIGSILMGLALSGSGEGRGSLSIAAHMAYDRGIALGLLMAAFVLGLYGEGAALVVLALAGLVEVALSTSTRYTPVRA